MGGMRDDVWRVQLKHTVRRHLEKELQSRARGIKVLSLFFIDRVGNYRDYDTGGKPVKGNFAELFEAELAELAKDNRYGELEWLKLPVETLHNGYFAQDRKGILKDTRGDTQADDEVYNLIMRDKERLLSLDEPLRFIFSHSALREGWDNQRMIETNR
jgi:type III restriction enzyme